MTINLFHLYQKQQIGLKWLSQCNVSYFMFFNIRYGLEMNLTSAVPIIPKINPAGVRSNSAPSSAATVLAMSSKSLSGQRKEPVSNQSASKTGKRVESKSSDNSDEKQTGNVLKKKAPTKKKSKK